MDHVWMQPPGGGKPERVEATPEVLVPLMVRGWRQVEAPAKSDQEKEE